MAEEQAKTPNESAEPERTVTYHPGIQQGVDFIYGGDQDQYLEEKEEG
ncbi:hypothetical protein LJK88_38840 [Paenibacillus sp. P26]|nr:hypothetical protein LJK88_38840 [Paenibacillus sp. P26]UUZ93134.1 hypothetical protein LJK87_49465 [Paenibacillus sp. P25]